MTAVQTLKIEMAKLMVALNECITEEGFVKSECRYRYQMLVSQIKDLKSSIDWFKSIGYVIVFLLVGCNGQEVWAKEYTNEQIVNAIYKAEGGKNAQYPYGIRSIKCAGETECRQICFNTVKNNRKRFADYGHKTHSDFIQFLSSRYAPVNAGNDPKGLNKNWTKNVMFFLNKKEK